MRPEPVQIGLFGGSFDPIHIGHLKSASTAADQLNLEEVIFIPCRISPHKAAAAPIAGDFRLRLVRAAMFLDARFSVSAVELRRNGPSYAIDTIRDFFKRFPKATFWFLLGQDAFCEFTSWRRYQEILRLVNLGVLTRPGARLVDPRGVLPVDIANSICYDFSSNEYTLKSGRLIRMLEVPPIDVSSREIRARIRQGLPIHEMVPLTVEKIILEEALYRP